MLCRRCRIKLVKQEDIEVWTNALTGDIQGRLVEELIIWLIILEICELSTIWPFSFNGYNA